MMCSGDLVIVMVTQTLDLQAQSQYLSNSGKHLYHHPQFLYKLRMSRVDVNNGSPSSQVSLMIIYRPVIFCWLGKEGFNILIDR